LISGYGWQDMDGRIWIAGDSEWKAKSEKRKHRLEIEN
jgi:hypothetical protein